MIRKYFIGALALAVLVTVAAVPAFAQLGELRGTVFMEQNGQKVPLADAKIDVFRMDHEALQFHLLQLLSPMHLTILTVEPEEGINQEMIRNCLHMMRFLKLNATIPVIQQLKTLAGNDPVHLQLIENFERSRKRDQVLYKLRPYLVAVVTILICILIFFLSRGETE